MWLLSVLAIDYTQYLDMVPYILQHTDIYGAGNTGDRARYKKWILIDMKRGDFVSRPDLLSIFVNI